MDGGELDLGPIEAHQEQAHEDYYLVTMHSNTLKYLDALVAEVKRLRGEGLKEYHWNDDSGYGGGWDYTVVASSLEKAREFATERFDGYGGDKYFLKYILSTEPSIYDFEPKVEGYSEEFMNPGG